MAYQNLLVETRDAVAIVTINRPQRGSRSDSGADPQP